MVNQLLWLADLQQAKIKKGHQRTFIHYKGHNHSLVRFWLVKSTPIFIMDHKKNEYVEQNHITHIKP